MKLCLLCLLSVWLLLPGCRSEQQTTNCLSPSGKYTNKTALSRCPLDMPADAPYYSFELQFLPGDSMLLDNGFEKWILQFSKEKDCRYRIGDATRYGDMYFVVESDSTIVFWDTAWTKRAKPTLFLNTADPVYKNWRFEQHVNHCFFAGQYFVYQDGQRMERPVIFLYNGQMNGLRPYIGYEVCYAGDCLEETDPPSNTVTFITDRGTKETFTFTINDGRQGIKLYSVGPPIPDIKGSRAIGPLVYELSVR